MPVQTPSIPKGTRDFSPIEVIRREFIFSQLKEVFKLHGYQPIETPAMENLSTLLGKYGEEGDKLLFRILNSGNFLADAGVAGDLSGDAGTLVTKISEKGLRYDLTVPFARYVVQHQNEITFPFRRYQVQPVWRADRPQKGRYREFFQCDVDVIGSNSLVNEAELIQIIDESFARLQLRVTIKLNNRKILSGIAEVTGQSEKIIPITVAIDKLEKIGLEKVKEELAGEGIPAGAIEKLVPLLQYEGSVPEKLAFLDNYLQDSEIGLEGVRELKEVFSLAANAGIQSVIELDISLARGLNYYTGIIIEVKSDETSIGSICGGGRYDNLTGIFGLPGISGVGVSFGADRIYDVMLALNRFPADAQSATKVLFVNFGPAEAALATKLAAGLRQAGVPCELFPDAAKLKKQFSYADNRGIPVVIVIGEEEMKTGNVAVKFMLSGEQKSIPAQDLVAYIKGVI